MKLENQTTIWGMKIQYLKEQCKRYKFYSYLLYCLDILVVILVCYVMYKEQTAVQGFVLVMLLTAFAFNFIYTQVLNPHKWQTYKFYLKHKGHTVMIKKYNLDEKTIYALLYCLGCKRLKDNKSLDDYKDLLLSTICEDNVYAKKVMKYLSKYEDENGNISCSILAVKNKLYFIDFVDAESVS